MCSSASTSATNAPGNRRRARAAVGLNDVAIDPDRALAEPLELHHRAERSADEPLNFLRAAADLALRRFARRPRRGRARQHAVFGRHPALARVAQKWRNAILDRRGADHFRAARLDQHGSFRVQEILRMNVCRTKLVVRAIVDAHQLVTHLRSCSIGRRRSRWPASVSTSLPSIENLHAGDGGQVRRQRADERIDGEDFVRRSAGMIGLQLGAQIDIDLAGFREEHACAASCPGESPTRAAPAAAQAAPR